MRTLEVVLLAVTSAGFYALAATLKHRSADQGREGPHLEFRHVGRFIVSMVTHRLWLAGILADAFGLALQVFALHLGALAVVQPLLVVGLLLALALNHLTTDGALRHRELVMAAALSLSLVGFLVISGAPNGTNGVLAADRGPAIAAAGIALASSAALISASRRVRRGVSAALLGTTVGISYAIDAALIKSCTNVATSGILSLLSSWQLYVLIAVGGAGLVLNQMAFQAGPLTASLPAATTVDPLVSIAIGVWVYDEHVRHSALAITAQFFCLAALCLATIALSRIAAADEAKLPARKSSTTAPTGTFDGLDR